MFNKLKACLIFVVMLGVITTSALRGQNANSLMDLKKLNIQLIEVLFLNKLNKHRKSLGTQSLKNNQILKQAADDHACYMSSMDDLTHTQIIKGKENIDDRIKYYKSDFKNWGENVCYIYLKRTMYIGKRKVKLNTYDQAAEFLFLN